MIVAIWKTEVEQVFSVVKNFEPISRTKKGEVIVVNCFTLQFWGEGILRKKLLILEVVLKNLMILL